MPVVQDSRMTEDALEFSEGFLIAVANNKNQEVQEFLELEPTLIYARDELGNTAINDLIIGGTQADLDTLRIILEVAQENGVLPDYRLANNRGHDAYHALQVHMEELATGLNDRFIELVDPALYARIIARIDAEEIATQAAERDALHAREEDYFDRNPNHELTQQLANGARIYTALTEESTNDAFKDLFTKQSSFYNFDEEKKFNAMNAELDAILKGFSFTPKPISFVNLESDLSIIVIPQEISDFLGKFYEYFFENHDHQ